MSETPRILLVNRAIITDRDRVLLLRRSDTDTHNPGKLEFPGGKLDDGEGLIDGLTREVREETGLLIRPFLHLAHVESEIIRTGKYQGRLYIALFHAAWLLGGELALSEEHSAASWEELERIPTDEMTTESGLALTSFRRMGIV